MTASSLTLSYPHQEASDPYTRSVSAPNYPLESPQPVHQQQQQQQHHRVDGSLSQTQAPQAYHHQQQEKNISYNRVEEDRARTTRMEAFHDPSSTPFLRDLNLVAEAAKRAQMAILVRDFGEVAL